MRNRLSFASVIMIIAMLACQIPGVSRPPGHTTITGVTIAPPTGEKYFSLEVKYEYVWDRENGNAGVFCSYITPSGKSIPIDHIAADGLDRDGEKFSKVQVFNFSIVPADGIVEFGVYTASCTTFELTSPTVTTNFMVVENSTPTPEPPSQPAATPTATLQTAALKGQIVFDFANAQSGKGPGWGGLLAEVTQECKPEVTITALSVVSGSCEKSHITARLVDESFTAQITGAVDADRNVTFSYDVSEIGNPNGSWRISYEGQGKFISQTEASGTASFSYSCSSGQDNLLWCNSQTHEAFSGTVSWSFVPLQ